MNIFRTHKSSMRNLRKLLSESTKVNRRRRMHLTIQITIMSWIVEILSFFVIFLGTFILGNKNSIVTLSLQTLTALCYLVVVPSMYLVSSSDIKTMVLSSKLYLAFNNMCCYRCDAAMIENYENEENEDARSENRENQNHNGERNIRQNPENSDFERVDTENSNAANANKETGNINQWKGELKPSNEGVSSNQTRRKEVKNASMACVLTDLEK